MASVQKDVSRGALVMGGASGIGLATAQLLAKEGVFVVIADRDEEKGRTVVADDPAIKGRGAFVHCDVSIESTVRDMVQAGMEALKANTIPLLNYVVCSAGCDFFALLSDAAKASCEHFDRAIAVNLRSQYLTLRECLPFLKAAARESGEASVLNVASIQAHRSFPGFAAYAATKGGIIAMTKQQAGELGNLGIRVNSVSPGEVYTPLGENSTRYENTVVEERVFGERAASAREREKADTLRVIESSCGARVPLMRALTAEPCAEAIVGLLKMKGVTGQDLIVDGGCSLLGFYVDRLGDSLPEQFLEDHLVAGPSAGP